ncbi:hypothetical protein CWI38_0007p0030 [Hamiltosporidium tvaerminnensis]|uniref:Uncharacterized protein n=1 Tax=Hamiltosporidium tvaerminnensis TaxID=1176355 RepID=A0A4Q9M5B8_9MICR|nr:hypothetical protein CWI38_0007p0030 [Hamiltosporidium tvaerminnensis]
MFISIYIFAFLFILFQILNIKATSGNKTNSDLTENVSDKTNKTKDCIQNTEANKKLQDHVDTEKVKDTSKQVADKIGGKKDQAINKSKEITNNATKKTAKIAKGNTKKAIEKIETKLNDAKPDL